MSNLKLYVIFFILISKLSLVKSAEPEENPLTTDELYGITKSEDNSFRIVDGHDAVKDDWPFITAVTCGLIHHCGGTLIKPNWVITAGHCVTGKSVEMQQTCLGELSARVGPADIVYVNITDHLKPKCRHLQLKKTVFSSVEANPAVAIKHLAHEKYNLESQLVNGAPVEVVSYDIALMKLNETYDGMKLGKMPTRKLEQGDNCKVAGWGLRGTMEQLIGLKNNLQEINITINSKEQCDELLHSIFDLFPTPMSQERKDACLANIVCGHGQTKFQSILAGDSGGPLICDDELHGVASLVLLKKSKTDGSMSYTGIFVEVISYMDWINDVMSGKLEKHDARNIEASDRNGCQTYHSTLNILFFFSTFIYYINYFYH